MKRIIAFNAEPDYCFSDEERETTVLIWPDSVPGMDVCFRCREMLESGEVLNYRIFGYDMPTTSGEYEEIMESIRTGDTYALEHL